MITCISLLLHYKKFKTLIFHETSNNQAEHLCGLNSKANPNNLVHIII